MPESKRLQRVLELVEPVDCIGDIGCDHGYISYALLEEHLAKKSNRKRYFCAQFGKSEESFVVAISSRII